jgi:hypothetical protein
MNEHPSKEMLPGESTKREVGTAAAKGALSAIPFVGGAIAEFLGLALSTPLAKRREAWLQDLATRLAELEGQIRDFSLDALADNEEFVSATLQATQAALRTHQKEKLEALRNAVLNTALNREPEEDFQTIFLSLIDRYSPAHLRLLKSLRNSHIIPGTDWLLGWERSLNPDWVRSHSPGFGDASQEFIRVLISDLESAGLIQEPKHRSLASEAGGPILPEGEKWTTEFGHRFLKFIESPLKAE